MKHYRTHKLNKKCIIKRFENKTNSLPQQKKEEYKF